MNARTLRHSAAIGGAVVLAAAAALVLRAYAVDDKGEKKPVAAKPALSVVVTRPQRATLPLTVHANGNIAAWQEASIGTEANGLRLAEVRVNVGDVVKRGEILATFSPETMQVDLLQTRASLAEAEATLADAAANAERAQSLRATGALSEATINQYVTAERTARARLEAQRAAVQARQLKVTQTAVVAPDDGVISARSATVGAVLAAGQELFRMIRQGRLEWRGELTPAQMGQIRLSSPVLLALPDGSQAKATIRQLAPALDANSRLGIAYADIAPGSSARASMYVRGRVELAATDALVVPGESVTIRDGRSYVFAVEGNRVKQVPVTTGRRVGNEIEIVQGMTGDERIAVRGAGFLNDGDLVAIASGNAAG